MSGAMIPFGVPAAPAPGTLSVATLIRTGRTVGPSWRFDLDELAWRDMTLRLQGDALAFVGLWTDGHAVHALFNEARPGDDVPHPLMASLTLDGPRYPGLSRARAAAAPYERMIRDLWGIEAMDARDARPIVDHGLWSATVPLASRPGPVGPIPEIPEFAELPPAVSEGGMVFGHGPATGGAEGPVHVRLGVVGDRIASVETRGGYAHRGMTGRMTGASILRAVDLAGRVGGGMHVAHQWALCSALERAFGVSVPLAADLARAALSEIERVVVHLTVLARTARAAEALVVGARLYGLREAAMRLCGARLGRRVLMDCVCAGGVMLRRRADDTAPAEEQIAALAHLCAELAALAQADVPALRALWWATPGLSARLDGVGVVSRENADRLGLGGVTGRACGRGGDIRPGLAAYGGIQIRPCTARGGDARARCAVRFDEIVESLDLLESLGAALSSAATVAEDAALHVPLVMPTQESGSEPRLAWGHGVVEAPHGRVWYVVALENGRIRHAFMADPSATLLSAQDIALTGALATERDVICGSFGVSAAAADL